MRASLFLSIFIVFSFVSESSAQEKYIPRAEQMRRATSDREVVRSQNEMMMKRGNNLKGGNIHLITPQGELAGFIRDLGKASDSLLAALEKDDKKKSKEIDKYAEKVLKLSHRIRKKLNDNKSISEAVAQQVSDSSSSQLEDMIKEIDHMVEDVDKAKDMIVWTVDQPTIEQAMKTLESVEIKAVTLRSMVK